MAFLLGSTSIQTQPYQETAQGPLSAKESAREATLEQSAPTAAPRAGDIRLNPYDGLKYVWIPPGTFMMGCSPGDNECFDWEKPAHAVTISKGFWIGQTVVTVGAYKRFTAVVGQQMPPGTRFNSGWANEKMPIVNVSWNDAQAYCQWSEGRLPTEAEWEYAARGGSTEARYGPLDDVAWHAGNSGRQRLDSAEIFKDDQANSFKRIEEKGDGTHEVAQKRANGFGLYDALGNVWEWVSDWYDEHYYQNSPSQDPMGPSSGETRVFRGGSWWFLPSVVRVSFRGNYDPARRGNVGGFRCVGDNQHSLMLFPFASSFLGSRYLIGMPRMGPLPPCHFFHSLLHSAPRTAGSSSLHFSIVSRISSGDGEKS